MSAFQFNASERQVTYPMITFEPTCAYFSLTALLCKCEILDLKLIESGQGALNVMKSKQTREGSLGDRRAVGSELGAILVGNVPCVLRSNEK